jgi:hypothetical protein
LGFFGIVVRIFDDNVFQSNPSNATLNGQNNYICVQLTKKGTARCEKCIVTAGSRHSLVYNSDILTMDIWIDACATTPVTNTFATVAGSTSSANSLSAAQTDTLYGWANSNP